MSSHRPGRVRPTSTPAHRGTLARTPRPGILPLLAALLAAAPLAAQTLGDASDPAEPGAVTEPAADPASALDVVPTGDWLRVDELEWEGQPIDIHLRTGYERPIIMPEPVTLTSDQSLDGSDVTIDVELVLFAPREHFAARTLVLIGERSDTRYRLAVRSDRTGSRVPLRIVAR